MHIGRAIKLARAARGISQGDLVVLMGQEVLASQVSLIEAGKRQPSLGTLEAMAQALDIPMPLLVFIANATAQQLDDPENRPILEQIGWWFLRA